MDESDALEETFVKDSWQNLQHSLLLALLELALPFSDLFFFFCFSLLFRNPFSSFPMQDSFQTHQVHCYLEIAGRDSAATFAVSL